MRINIARYWSLNNTGGFAICLITRKNVGFRKLFQKRVSKWIIFLHCKCQSGSSWKQFLSGEPYPVTRPLPESVSEVSAECEFQAKIKINVMAEESSTTREICNSLSLSTQKWVMTDCPPWQEKAASEWLCNEPLSLIQWRKPTKVKAVHKIRNKDLVLPLVLGWHFWDSSGKRRT